MQPNRMQSCQLKGGTWARVCDRPKPVTLYPLEDATLERELGMARSSESGVKSPDFSLLMTDLKKKWETWYRANKTYLWLRVLAW